jgi:glycerol-3-phosphate dehydrogenase
MKIRLYLPLLLAVIMLLSAGCSDQKSEVYYKQIDSVLVVLSQAENKLLTANHDSISKKYALYLEYAELLKNDAFKKDAESKEWQYLTSYHYVRKPFQRLASNYKDYQKDIITAREQLTNLKHDIRKSSLTAEEMERFIQEEKTAADFLAHRITSRVDAALKEEVNFDTTHPHIVLMTKSLK